jgi:SAM-dependent methyltransferase
VAWRTQSDRSWGNEEVVRAAYVALLGREPESRKVVREACAEPDLTRYLANVVASPEFKHRMFRELIDFERAYIDGAPNPISIHITDAERRQLLDVVGKVWKAYGDSDPYFSVLSHERFRGKPAEEAMAEFFGSGKAEVDSIFNIMKRCEIDPASVERVVEFGCGVGRVSLWLAKNFPEVCGIDISQRHLDIAVEKIDAEGVKGFSPLQIDTLDGLSSIPSFDLLYTRLVLQHNPPPIQHEILLRLLESARAGALVIFQIPTCCVGYHFAIDEYLEGSHKIREMETHALPQREVFKLLESTGFDVQEVFFDNCVGDPDWHSQLFVARRRMS